MKTVAIMRLTISGEDNPAKKVTTGNDDRKSGAACTTCLCEPPSHGNPAVIWAIGGGQSAIGH